MPPIILGEAGKEEYTGEFPCGRTVRARCEIGQFHQGRIVLSPETNTITVIEDTSEHATTRSLAEFIAQECAHYPAEQMEVFQVIHTTIRANRDALCEASICMMQFRQHNNNVHIQMTGSMRLTTWTILNAVINPNSVRTHVDPNPNNHRIGSANAKYCKWDQIYGPQAQFMIENQGITQHVRGDTLLRQMEHASGNGYENIWNWATKLNTGKNAQSLVYVGAIPKPT